MQSIELKHDLSTPMSDPSKLKSWCATLPPGVTARCERVPGGHVLRVYEADRLLATPVAVADSDPTRLAVSVRAMRLLHDESIYIQHEYAMLTAALREIALQTGQELVLQREASPRELLCALGYRPPRFIYCSATNLFSTNDEPVEDLDGTSTLTAFNLPRRWAVALEARATVFDDQLGLCGTVEAPHTDQHLLWRWRHARLRDDLLLFLRQRRLRLAQPFTHRLVDLIDLLKLERRYRH